MSSSKFGIALTLHSGSGLPGADADGFSDPYCIVEPHDLTCFCAGSPELYATSVKMHTLSPEWEETIHLLGCSESGPDAHLLIRVMDEDAGSADDALGQYKLPLAAVERGLSRSTVTLSGAGSQQGRATLIISVQRTEHQDFSAENTAVLPIVNPTVRFGLRWDSMTDDGRLQATDLDLMCFLATFKGEVSSKHRVYYGSGNIPDYIRFSGDSKFGEKTGYDEEAVVDLGRTPANTQTVHVVVMTNAKPMCESVHPRLDLIVSESGDEDRGARMVVGLDLSAYGAAQSVLALRVWRAPGGSGVSPWLVTVLGTSIQRLERPGKIRKYLIDDLRQVAKSQSTVFKLMLRRIKAEFKINSKTSTTQLAEAATDPAIALQLLREFPDESQRPPEVHALIQHYQGEIEAIAAELRAVHEQEAGDMDASELTENLFGLGDTIEPMEAGQTHASTVLALAVLTGRLVLKLTWALPLFVNPISDDTVPEAPFELDLDANVYFLDGSFQCLPGGILTHQSARFPAGASGGSSIAVLEEEQGPALPDDYELDPDFQMNPPAPESLRPTSRLSEPYSEEVKLNLGSDLPADLRYIAFGMCNLEGTIPMRYAKQVRAEVYSPELMTKVHELNMRPLFAQAEHNFFLVLLFERPEHGSSLADWKIHNIHAPYLVDSGAGFIAQEAAKQFPRVLGEWKRHQST